VHSHVKAFQIANPDFLLDLPSHQIAEIKHFYFQIEKDSSLDFILVS